LPERPTYQRIADGLRTRIASGELAAGATVPSARRIAREHGVALATATRVLAALRDDGLVRAVSGVGTVVVDRPDRAPGPARVPEPGPRRVRDAAELSTEQVVAVALRIADADGLGALSMRRIAAELGVATMSIYPRVRGKDELLAMMLDAVFAEYPLPTPVTAPPSPDGWGWRQRIEYIAHLQWTAYQRHPWVPGQLSTSRPQQAPHGMVHTEALLRAFDGYGLSPTTMLHAGVTVAGFVRGCAIGLEAELRAEQDTGLTADQWMRVTQPSMEAVLARWSFPMLTAIAAVPEVEMSQKSLFEFGLARLLDGFELWLQQVGQRGVSHPAQ
jgi:AcrR family transcriptional regulator